MRFNFTRLSLLKFFILNKKRTRKTLLVINFAIFLTIFAATAAIISLYVENKINEKEFILMETQRTQNNFHQRRSMFPVFHGSIDNSLMFDRMVNRFNLFISSTNFGDKIISDRELYFYRTHALIGPTYDLFEEDIGIEDINFVIDTFYEEGEYKDSLNHKKIIEKFYYFKKKYQEDFKKNTKDFEQYTALSKSYLLKDTEYSQESINLGAKYKDYYNFAWEINLWFIDLLKLMEIVYLDLMESQKLEMKNFNQEIINLSKNESRMIFFAFILQLIIFIIIQFFEISSVTAEFSKKVKKK
jgi:hypothetical protein